MKTIETKATVTKERLLTIQVPSDIEPGEHQVVLVVDERPVKKQERSPLEFPVIHVKSWPDNISLRREEIYGKQ